MIPKSRGSAPPLRGMPQRAARIPRTLPGRAFLGRATGTATGPRPRPAHTPARRRRPSHPRFFPETQIPPYPRPRPGSYRACRRPGQCPCLNCRRWRSSAGVWPPCSRDAGFWPSRWGPKPAATVLPRQLRRWVLGRRLESCDAGANTSCSTWKSGVTLLIHLGVTGHLLTGHPPPLPYPTFTWYFSWKAGGTVFPGYAPLRPGPGFSPGVDPPPLAQVGAEPFSRRRLRPGWLSRPGAVAAPSRLFSWTPVSWPALGNI